MNQTTKDELIEFLLNMKDELMEFLRYQKENITSDIQDYVYPGIDKQYRALTQDDIDEINLLRKKMVDIYNFMDKIGEDL